MQIRLRVRPRQGYHYPYKIDELQIDSSARLETIQQSYSTQGSTTRLYLGQYELPLNSSIGSHNLDDDAIIECCRSPALAAALSACLKDLDEVKKLRPTDRFRANLMSILQTPLHIQNDPSHDIWQASSWTDESIKSRTINFATIKAVIQRMDRYQVHDLPRCNDCKSLYDALQQHNVWSGGMNGRMKPRWNQQVHIFKPNKKNGSGPTTNWILLDAKLDIQTQIKREFQFTIDSDHDYLEEFVRRDHSRHSASTTASTPKRRRKTADATANIQHDDSEAYLAYLAATPPRSSQPHSPPQRAASQYTSPTATNASPSTPRNQKYVPQYSSAPFSVLASLHRAMHAKHGRKLTLTEDELKRLAQHICRSNLYDKSRIRGRNAFACMDGLIKKNLVRKEIVRNPEAFHSEIEKWGLLPPGEVMGHCCAEFERAVQRVIPKEKNDTAASGKSMNVLLCMDSREDVHYLQRIRWNCEDENVPFLEKELPAGDYLFLEESLDEMIPLVIERKSWSDLADSCLGKGRARNRLDCVKLDSASGCSGNCQLCKMKRCGCTQIMFIIEGERCHGVQRNGQCTINKCCSACNLLCERHNITQTELEGVLIRLQIDHGCFIHYTKSFNDTITSLFAIRTLLQKSASFAGKNGSLSFEHYISNAQRRGQNDNDLSVFPRFENVHEWDVQALASTMQNTQWNEKIVHLLLGSQGDQLDKNPAKYTSNFTQPKETIVLDSDSDGSVVEVAKPPRKNAPETICLDADSDGDSSIIEIVPGNNDSLHKSVDSMIILDNESKPPRKRQASWLSPSGPLPSTKMKQPSSMTKKEPSTPRSTTKSNSNGTSSILIFHSLDKYEEKFGKHIEKIWRETFLQTDGNPNEIFNNALEKLNRSKEVSLFPHVHGRTISSFSLWLQIVMGLQVKFVQGGYCVAELRQKLGSKQAHAANSNPTALPSGGPKSKMDFITTSRNSGFDPTLYLTPQKSHSNLTVSKPSSSNDAVREARLRRFDKSEPTKSTASHNRVQSLRESGPIFPDTDKWSCSKCTFENELHFGKCAVCGNKSSEEWSCTQCTYKNSPSVTICGACDHARNGSRKNRRFINGRSIHSHDDEPWLCSCSFENSKKDTRCYDCGALNPDAIPEISGNRASLPNFTEISDPNQSLKPETSARKKVRCGACGNEGHNRMSATALNCIAYYDDKEVERREKIQRKRLTAIEEERQKIERIERDSITAERLRQELLTKTNEIEQNIARAEEFRKDALKRAKDKMKRLQKRNR